MGPLSGPLGRAPGPSTPGSPGGRAPAPEGRGIYYPIVGLCALRSHVEEKRHLQLLAAGEKAARLGTVQRKAGRKLPHASSRHGFAPPQLLQWAVRFVRNGVAIVPLRMLPADPGSIVVEERQLRSFGRAGPHRFPLPSRSRGSRPPPWRRRPGRWASHRATPPETPVPT